MKKASATLSFAFDARRANFPQVASVLIALSLVVGLLLTDTLDEMAAYLLVALSCAVPIAIWIRTGTAGIPVLPAVSALSFVYYGLPILRKNGDLAQFEPTEILSMALTVSLFLASATLSWWLLLLGSTRQLSSASPELTSPLVLVRVMFFGLALGIVYHAALYAGWLSWLGPAFGVVRSIMLTIATAACFILGYIRAQGALRGQTWAVAVAGMGMMVLLSWASLILISGIIFCAVAIFGYAITSKRVPWVFLFVAMAVIFVLQAGKDEVRQKYWFEGKNYGEEISLINVPDLMMEWGKDGLTMMVSGGSYSSVADRASLVDILLQVQRLTPDYVPPLEGETYALIPQMLVPRFVDSDKITSQAAMDMLNVQFGFQTMEGTQSTAVGWGLIAEAYANFRLLGVVGAGLVLGFITGILERWSVGAPLISLPSLIAVTALMQLINMEGDAAALVTSLFQSVVSIAIFYWGFGSFSKKSGRTQERVLIRR